MKTFAILLCVALIAARPVEADQMKLSDLYDICTGPGDVNAMACRFFILGVVEGSTTGQRPDNAKGWPCVPEGISQDAMVIVVKLKMGQDLALFPQDKSIPAVSFVIAALATQYPCQ